MPGTTFRAIVPVRTPFRLDYTAEVLRRLSSNVVDVVEPDGTYVRALRDGAGTAVVRVTQPRPDAIALEVHGAGGARFVPVVERLLGTRVDLRPWYRAVEGVPWLARFANLVEGVKPPRYPTMWEALCHSIVFQQISIHAAGAIMQRMVETVAQPVRSAGSLLYPFPSPEALAATPVETLRAASLSINKVTALQAVARSFIAGTMSEALVERLPTAQALAELATLRGIGPWSANVVLLRGLGRLDAFPLRDSGVAASLRKLHPDGEVNLDELLATLREQRGMLYFHLLLGRIVRAREAPATLGGL